MRRAVLTGAALARKDDPCPLWQNECGNGKLRDPMRNSAIAAPVGREGKGDCKLQRLVNENQWEERWPKVTAAPAGLPEQLSTDHTSPSIWRDLSKCIQSGLCTDVCG